METFAPVYGPATDRAARAFEILPTLTGRAARAARVLLAGGYFETRLESNYFGRSQFRTRLRDSQGQAVAGIGGATLADLSACVRNVACWRTSVWASRCAWATMPQTGDEARILHVQDMERDYV